MSPTVACVLRSSPAFSRDYVVRLFESVREHWTGKLDFLALTDTPIRHPGIREIGLRYDWPGYWSKLEFFRPDVLGDLLIFDLDTMVVGSLDDIQANDRHTMLRRFPRKYRHDLASGLMFLPAAVRPTIWRQWIQDPDRFMKLYRWSKKSGRVGGDQGFLQDTWQRWGISPEADPNFDYARWHRLGIARWQELLPGQIYSYRYHVAKRGAVPADARVICFHGRPRPHEIGWTLPKRSAS